VAGLQALLKCRGEQRQGYFGFLSPEAQDDSTNPTHGVKIVELHNVTIEVACAIRRKEGMLGIHPSGRGLAKLPYAVRAPECGWPDSAAMVTQFDTVRFGRAARCVLGYREQTDWRFREAQVHETLLKPSSVSTRLRRITTRFCSGFSSKPAATGVRKLTLKLALGYRKSP
jgi:hypothetical protein